MARHRSAVIRLHLNEPGDLDRVDQHKLTLKRDLRSYQNAPLQNPVTFIRPRGTCAVCGAGEESTYVDSAFLIPSSSPCPACGVCTGEARRKSSCNLAWQLYPIRLQFFPSMHSLAQSCSPEP